MNQPAKIALAAFGLLILAALIIYDRTPIRIPVVEPGLPATTSTPGSLAADLPILADRLPEFQGITRWWNTPDQQALSPAQLKGKVVLVDFWTYSCINCIRTYPFLKSIYAKYADKGLVIVGVHTPEFAFEGEVANVDREIKKNALRYPIALDPNYGTWNAYQNNSWPAEYFFDRAGRLRHTHFGEGEYDQSEAIIRALLAEGSRQDLGTAGNAGHVPDFGKIGTSETYFGLARTQSFTGTLGKENAPVQLAPAATLGHGAWTVGGAWRWTQEYAESLTAGNVFRMNVQAAKFHLVLSASDNTDKHLEIFVDGKKIQDLTIRQPALYTIADFPDAGRHLVEIRIQDPGVKFFSATFS